MANQTVYPFGTGGSLPSSVGIINDCVTGGADKALAAEQGKILNMAISETWIEVEEDGLFFVDGNLKIGVKIDSTGIHSIGNSLSFIYL